MSDHSDIPQRLPLDDGDWQEGQRAMARALRAWRAGPAVAPVMAAMKRFGKGTPFERCAALADLFGTSPHAADAFAASLTRGAGAALEANPLGQWPMPHGGRDAVPSLVLARYDRATLALAVYDGAALTRLPAPQTVRYQPYESWVRVLAGSGSAEHILRRGREDDAGLLRTTLQSALLPMSAGDTFHRYGPREAFHVRRVPGTMVVLRLERRLEGAGPVREHSLPDGALVHQASASREDSRDELIVALLGQMRRKDALPTIAEVALSGASGEGAESPAGEALRWQALRELVAMDGRLGRQVIARIAAEPDDPLAGRAASLLADPKGAL